MKYSVTALLLLGLLSLSLVSARARRAHRHRHDSDDESSESGPSCDEQLAFCYAPIGKYYPGPRGDFDDTVTKVRDAGAKQVCSDLLELGECAVETLQVPECQYLASFYRTEVSRGLKLAHHICDDSLDELEGSWNCLLNVQTLNLLPQCESEAEQTYDSCIPNPLENCVVDLYAKNPQCEAGAFNLLRANLPEAIKIVLYHKCRDSQVGRSPTSDMARLLNLLK